MILITILKNLIVYLLYFMSFLMVRSKNIWVFGSYGVFNDNSKYLFLEDIPNVKKIWIAKSKKEREYILKKYNLNNVYLRRSFKGYYYCLRAKLYIYSCYVSEINHITSGGAICINLWHGIPLKVIEFDIKNGPLSERFNSTIKSKFLYPVIYRKHNYVLCPSIFVYDYSFKSAFRMNDKNIILAQYPRINDLLEKRKMHIEKNYGSKNILYVPTWRDYNPNFLNEINLDLAKLNELCRLKNLKFLIKLHSNSNFKISNDNFEHIEVLPNDIDSNELMIDSYMLISDYSSIVYDYLNIDKPIILYNFDKEDYLKSSRKFYDQVNGIKFAPEVCSFNDLLDMIEVLVSGVDDYKVMRNNARSKLFFNDVSNESLKEKILKIIENKGK